VRDSLRQPSPLGARIIANQAGNKTAELFHSGSNHAGTYRPYKATLAYGVPPTSNKADGDRGEKECDYFRYAT
jgi:hypothetical protein